ncbi:MAG TPA: helix-turn-helix transcriptional regulator [Candidatus Saccharimonadales bacterium]|nr:helix-turn-helix transcriptional regulator [Candidatus Saccharimonadales bacterium]
MGEIPQAEMKRAEHIANLAVQANTDVSQAIGSLSMLVEEVTGGEVDPLTIEELTELNNVSLGLTPQESMEVRSRAEAIIDEDTVRLDRHAIIDKLGVETMPQAVGKAIELGMIVIIPEQGPPPKIKPKAAEVFKLVADGKSFKEIQEELGIHRNTVTNRLNAVREALDARDLPHAIRRAYETGWFRRTREQLDRSHLMHIGVGLILSAWEDVLEPQPSQINRK